MHNIVPPEVWGKRYEEINKFEKKLVDSGTTIIKVAMFVSPEQQKKQRDEQAKMQDDQGRGGNARGGGERGGGERGGDRDLRGGLRRQR